jgi:predicted TIM-barrel fold metal-dependent hydrolase
MLGLNAVAGKPREKYNIDAARYDEMRPGCWDVHERVRDMSAGGQLAGLNFPNWTGFAGQVLNQGPDRDTNLVMIKAYNDWHVDEWCGAYPDRFIPCGIIPLFDADLAAQEIKRLAAKGCYAVTFSENPTAYDLPSINTDYWDPLFGACSDEGTVPSPRLIRTQCADFARRAGERADDTVRGHDHQHVDRIGVG